MSTLAETGRWVGVAYGRDTECLFGGIAYEENHLRKKSNEAPWSGCSRFCGTEPTTWNREQSIILLRLDHSALKTQLQSSSDFKGLEIRQVNVVSLY
jgi:hypothetical protein